MKKKRTIMVLALALMLIMAVPVLAKTSERILEYKGTKAIATLETDFNWSVFGKDYGKAKTKFTTGNNGYRVAVRIERWDDKYTMADYKYDSSSSLAQCNYTWTDVYAYMSRHSIDNSSNTVEYAVDSFNHVE
ncbi:hypothetical protein SAMN02745135_02427 [Caloranaerobacter azorensis DSM 13643]|uniref:Uncharacterized protein n=1 Tax=Caloranaerobacter azorensis DSM 13643 TaxID=1121264 RepID=A0A1M5WDS3_9FIRM|nr:hypothetical protein [Caloranaerobacter azorensis]SHH85655.1 hypothetical protein SAMN02745135_02427 [Caloranaerobacter azorensis DSM 13643]